jgi:DNA-directed RNA polymerase subunit RPC12/RpoP
MDLEASIECPNCMRKTKIKVKEMVPGRKKTCSGCGAEFSFTGDDGRKAQKALDDLKKLVK